MMHNDEVNTSLDLAHSLIYQQFPDCSNLAITPIHPQGTDNMMYQLGDNKVIRLPRMSTAAQNIEKEAKWLPKLGPQLPINIPEVLAMGQPNENYPFNWLVCSKLEGTNPLSEITLNHYQAAVDLGNFLYDLQTINTQDAPECNRGKPLSSRDTETRDAISKISDLYDTKHLLTIWNEMLANPIWTGDPVWIHGDLHAGNLLAENGRVTAILDFGSAGIGDPACDLMAAWTLLTPETREIFRTLIKPDKATWNRGRAWAFTFGVVAYPYYRQSNPTLATIAKQTIDAVLTT